jgi:hypothetical protein
LRFDEVVRLLRLPFLDGDDVMAGAAIEACLREGRKLEFHGEELAAFLEQAGGPALALSARAEALAGTAREAEFEELATQAHSLHQRLQAIGKKLAKAGT